MVNKFMLNKFKSSKKNHQPVNIKSLLIKLFLFIIIPIILIVIFLYIKAPIFFKPNNKVIQYQEEVKLSNGEMIWVDIKRHYWLSGGAMGDSSMLTGSYMPGIVEISWDTGFEGVGRQSMFLINALSVDKYNDTWHIIGNIAVCSLDGNSGTSINSPRGGFDPRQRPRNGKCIPFLGTWVGDLDARRGQSGIHIYSINSENEFVKYDAETLPQSVKYNILYLDFDEAKSFENRRLSWKEKLAFREKKEYNYFYKSINPRFNGE